MISDQSATYCALPYLASPAAHGPVFLLGDELNHVPEQPRIRSLAASLLGPSRHNLLCWLPTGSDLFHLATFALKSCHAGRFNRMEAPSKCIFKSGFWLLVAPDF